VKFLSANGVETTLLHWPDEKEEPNALTYISQGKIDLVINIPKSFEQEEVRNDYLIRRQAVEFGVPIITSPELASTLVGALQKPMSLVDKGTRPVSQSQALS
jgi:carbamoyl-phosphate synthase large subunit